jgi:hypothetical protein
MEDSYPSLNGGESLEMEWEDNVETKPKDKDEKDVVVMSRWPEQEQHLVSSFAKDLEETIVVDVKTIVPVKFNTINV